jgi:hypothetical protein
MGKNILNEIETMKYLLGYKRGVVISEQEVTDPNKVPNAVNDVNNVINAAKTPGSQPETFGGYNNPKAAINQAVNVVNAAAGINTQPATAAPTTADPTTAAPTTGPDATQMECIKQYGQNPTLGVAPLNTKVWLPNSDGSYSWFGKDYSFQMASNKFTDESVGTWACNSGKLTITLNNKQTWTDGKWSGDPFTGMEAATATSTTDVVKMGVKNPKITELQTLLNTKFNSGLTPDGLYGPKTAKALSDNIQAILALKTTGTPPAAAPTTGTPPAAAPTTQFKSQTLPDFKGYTPTTPTLK